MSNVIKSVRLPRASGSVAMAVTVDGQTVEAYPGETVATVLLALGRQTFRHTDRLQASRGLFCGMGVCFDCLVTIDGQANVRACVTPVQAGMAIETGGPSDA